MMNSAGVIPTIKSNLSDLPRQAALLYGSAPALTFKSTTCTYAGLWRQVCEFASGLAATGLRRDDRVAVLLDKRIETVVAIFGTAAAGGVSVPVNPLLKPQQVAYILADCDVRVLVTSPERLNLLKEHVTDNHSIEHIVIVDDGSSNDSRNSLNGCKIHLWTQVLAEGNAPVGAERHS